MFMFINVCKKSKSKKYQRTSTTEGVELERQNNVVVSVIFGAEEYSDDDCVSENIEMNSISVELPKYNDVENINNQGELPSYEEATKVHHQNSPNVNK